MKAIFSLKRHSYLKTIGTLLIAVALITGIVGCEGEPETYELNVAVNPAGAGTATDDTGGAPYEEGEDVDISAVPADCYRFISWSAPAGTFANANNATTVFTMPAQDVTVTANFEAVPPDHFKFYEVDSETALPIEEVVQLDDQFGTFEAMVGKAISFGNPVEKVHGDTVSPIVDDTRHYTLYELIYEEEPQAWKVMINNQFQDDVELTVFGPYYLAVPTQKEDHGMPVCLNHYLVYEAYGPLVNDEVVLSDQFVSGEGAVVYEPYYFANPVQKTVAGSAPSPIEDPDLHLVLYDIWDVESPPIDTRIQIDNQFGPQTLDLLEREYLAVPSQKISWEKPLNHFKTYWADWPFEPPQGWEPPTPVDVQLEDQLVTINATVWEPYLFANPAFKGITEEDWTPIWDPNDHLTFYYIEYASDPQVWQVTVNNQFGNDQALTIAGPFYLAVPTQKVEHDPPVDLNHFLVYDVIDHGVYLPKEVYIQDQFIDGWTNVYDPRLFAVPAQKTHPLGGTVTPIVGDDHLVFYEVDGIYYWDTYNLPVVNQFGEQYLDVFEGEGNLLGVPSKKIEWTHIGPFYPD